MAPKKFGSPLPMAFSRAGPPSSSKTSGIKKVYIANTIESNQERAEILSIAPVIADALVSTQGVWLNALLSIRTCAFIIATGEITKEGNSFISFAKPPRMTQ
jgi:hypothetical protein